MSDKKRVIERVEEVIDRYADRLQGYGLISWVCELIQYVKDGNDLKPCPFCGGEADYIIKPDEGVFVMCRGCGNRTIAGTDYDEDGNFLYRNKRAIDFVKGQWNKREGDREE